MAYKSTQGIEIPEAGDLTREQGWAALSSLNTKLDMLLWRLVSLGDGAECALPSDEAEEVRALAHRFKQTVKILGRDVLDKLADLSETEPVKRESYPSFLDKFPKSIRDVIGGYYGDVYRWGRKEGNDQAVLALAMLEESEVLDAIEIGTLIEKKMRPDSKYGKVWTCPRCDDCNLGKIGSEDCRRCYGWGYVFGEKPDDDQYDWTEKGRLALNRGEAWTPEQEAAEEARLKVEWDAE
jgi:hypothetical protein